MKVDFTTTLKAIDGSEVKENDVAIPLALPIINALMADEQGIDGAKKLLRFNLAKRIQSGEQDIVVEEAALIKELVGKLFNPLVVGNVYELLEG